MDLILITIVAVHLLAVNLAGAGPLLAAWVDWRATRRNLSELSNAARRLAIWSIAAAMIGMLLGGAALMQLVYWQSISHDSYRYIFQKRVPADRWWFAGAELLFYLLAMITCVLLWRRLERRPWWRRLLAIAAGTNLLYHFPALFTMLAMLNEQNKWGWGPLDRQLYLRLLRDPETIARVVHVWLASLAVAGLALCWIGASRSSKDAKEPVVLAAVIGARWSLAASLLQVPVGVWLVTMLSATQMERLMTGRAIVIFSASIVIALALMHQLAMVSLGAVSRRRLSLATLQLILVVLLMTATLHVVRG